MSGEDKKEGTMDVRNPQRTGEDLVDFDEFCHLVPDGQKADLIDGVIHMASPDSRRPNRLNAFVASLIEQFDAAHDLGGETYISRFAFKLSEIRAPEPDIAYVCRDRLRLVHESAMEGGPDIAVELVSRESRQRDYVEKRELYREAGVREYWIIDSLRRYTEFLRLAGDVYNVVPLENNRIFRSEVLPGFWLDIEWLIADQLPNAYRCLREILAD